MHHELVSIYIFCFNLAKKFSQEICELGQTKICYIKVTLEPLHLGDCVNNLPACEPSICLSCCSLKYLCATALLILYNQNKP